MEDRGAGVVEQRRGGGRTSSERAMSNLASAPVPRQRGHPDHTLAEPDRFVKPHRRRRSRAELEARGVNGKLRALLVRAEGQQRVGKFEPRGQTYDQHLSGRGGGTGPPSRYHLGPARRRRRSARHAWTRESRPGPTPAVVSMLINPYESAPLSWSASPNQVECAVGPGNGR